MQIKTYVATCKYIGLDNIVELTVTDKGVDGHNERTFTYEGDCRGLSDKGVAEVYNYLTESGTKRALVLSWGGPTACALRFKHLLDRSGVYPVDLKITFGAYTVTSDLDLLCKLLGLENTGDANILFTLYNRLRDVPREMQYLMNPYLLKESELYHESNFGGFLGSLNRDIFTKQMCKFKEILRKNHARLYENTNDEKHLHTKYRNILLHLEQRLPRTKNDAYVKTREGSLISKNRVKPLNTNINVSFFFESLKEEFGYNPFPDDLNLTEVPDFILWQHITEVNKNNNRSSQVGVWRTMYQTCYKDIQCEEELRLLLTI